MPSFPDRPPSKHKIVYLSTSPIDTILKLIYNAPAMDRKKPMNSDEGIEMIFEESGDSDVGATIRHTAEDAELADVEDDFKGELKKWKEKLTICQKERQEYLDGWQRARADHLNYKQREEAQREQENERNTARFIEKLLPLCDSFDMALADIKKGGGDGENWRAGVEQIYNQLAAVLKSYTVEVLDPAGAPFDPHFHEAVSEIPVSDAGQDHTVLEVLQKGYTVGERLIRPAKVVVGNYKNRN